MRNFVFMLLSMTSFLWACTDAPEVQPVESLSVLSSDSMAVLFLRDAMNMDDENYPVNWVASDTSTWDGLEFDTIVDPITSKKWLAVTSATLYLVDKNRSIPGDIYYFEHLENLKIYGCTGSKINGDIPRTVKSILIDRINPEDRGYMELDEYREGDGELNISKGYNIFERIEIHGVAMKSIKFKASPKAEIDLSDNLLEGAVPWAMCAFLSPVNLDNNRYESFAQDRYLWRDAFRNDPQKYGCTVPYLRNNNITFFPEWVLQLNTWPEQSMKFIGNPGFVMP